MTTTTAVYTHIPGTCAGRLLYLVACLGWLLLPSVASSPAGSLRQSAPRLSPVSRPVTVLNLVAPVSALCWSPVGRRFVYITGNELRDWPEGRRVRLPAAISDGDNPPRAPLSWMIRWRNDGRQLVLMRDKQDAVVYDAQTFRILRTLSDVYSVWWQSGRLCYVPWVDSPTFTPRSRQPWYWGNRRRFFPPGLMVTDVSAGGEVWLARIPRNRRRDRWRNIALLKVNPRTGTVVWRKNLYREDVTVEDFTHTDRVLWNNTQQAGAVVVSTDTAGGLGGVSRLYAVRRTHVTEPSAAPEELVFVECQPSWVQGKILAVLRYWRESGLKTINRMRLVLFDPTRGTTTVLREHAGLLAAGVSRGGRVAAYSLRDGPRNRIVLLSFRNGRGVSSDM